MEMVKTGVFMSRAALTNLDRVAKELYPDNPEKHRSEILRYLSRHAQVIGRYIVVDERTKPEKPVEEMLGSLREALGEEKWNEIKSS